MFLIISRSWRVFYDFVLVVEAKNLGTKLQRLGPLGTFCHSEAQEKVLTLNCLEIDWEMSLEVSLDCP